MASQTNHGHSMDIACFFTYFVLEGIQRCSGIFFSWILDQSEEEDRQTAAIPFVLSRATAYIVSVLCRNVVHDKRLESSLQSGIFLGVLGVSISFISSDIIWLSICWGIIFGAGIGISSPEPLKVSQKFRSQPLLLLLCCAAPSIGCLLLPYFLHFLLSCYGLCGCLLIVSGVILNAYPFILVAMYRFKVRTPRSRKKYEINGVNRNSRLVPKPDVTGVDNKCFEDENSSFEECIAEASDRKNNIKNLNKVLHRDNAQSRKNSNLFPIDESNASDVQIIPTVRKDTGFIVKSDIRENGKMFEKDFSEEDILFELSSNVSRNGINQYDCKRSGSKLTNRIPDFTNENAQRNRKFTIVNAVSKRTMNVISEDEVNSSENSTASILEARDSSNVLTSRDSANNQPKTDSSSLRNRLQSDPLNTLTQNDSLAKSEVSPTNIFSKDYPLEIKVHVVECTFTEDDLRDGRLFNQNTPNSKRGGYRRHSNSLVTNHYDNINFSSLDFSNKYINTSNLYRNATNTTSQMHLIAEDEELTMDASKLNNVTGPREESSNRQCSLKKIFKPTCLVVIYAFVIHEVTLVTLLTIFDDHIDGLESPATGVLPCFGLGGILGRLSMRYWGDRLLLEGSHAAAALLFILDGVVVAGILWSPNIYWIGGFYAALGFLEIGISTAVSNLVSDHIEEDAKSILFTTCKILCGICSLFVPYTIGLSRDDMGEYDGLLQITSGLSVLCALLCYILPRITLHLRESKSSI